MDDALQRLEALQEKLTDTLDFIGRLEQIPLPTAEATDRSGAVTVRLALDGLPESVRLHAGWRRTTSASALGSAVVEAAQLAVAERVTQWSRDLVAKGIAGPQQQLTSPSGGVTSSVPTPRLSGHQPPSPSVREPSEIVEDLLVTLAVMEQALASSSAGSTAQRGTAADGRVRVQLSAQTLQSCEFDQGWLATVSDNEVESALQAAVASARSAMAAAPENAAARLGRRSDELIGEITAALERRGAGTRTLPEGAC
ncbi:MULTISPECIES: hypothetical protein [Streptacidiphilus]|uniref:YbaB/EbfC DNA-binding family protein n=1 Tax=Streptacidiphilus cavernicola TaxID=3342716 RepID=A0ABV6ULP6_9ACTN|nr:hypothetical protein [Streptacidiphilus jeojiense]